MAPDVRGRTMVIVLAVAAACASPGMPPGGPEDKVPPLLVSVSPDTSATNVKASAVTFRFNEVVSERPAAASSLDKLVVLSPSDGAARVRWRRKAIQVRPRRSFRPNTTYTITLLPGIADLRGNVHTTPFTTMFSTGPELSRTRLSGVVFDWVSGKPAARAFVQAHQRTDTTFTWIAQADSAGRFDLRSFPSGSYLVRAIIDANDNRGLDPREAWDSVGVAVADSARVEIYAFVHDTIGPRINAVTVADSVTLPVEFDKAIDPKVPVTPAQFVVLASDSTTTAVVALPSDSTINAERTARERPRSDSGRAPSAADSAQVDSVRRARAAAPNPTDSRVPLPRPARGRPAARVDTVPLPKPTRALPRTRLNLRLAKPLKPSTTYRLRATDIRGLLGNARTSDKLFTTPKPPEPPPADSVRRTTPTPRSSADSLRRMPPTPSTGTDSLRRVTPPPQAPPVKP